MKEYGYKSARSRKRSNRMRYGHREFSMLGIKQKRGIDIVNGIANSSKNVSWKDLLKLQILKTLGRARG